MKRSPRGALVCAITIALAAMVHFAAGRWLAQRDVLVAVTTRFDLLTVLAAAALMSTRLFLLLLAPGWVLYLVAAPRLWVILRRHLAR